MMRRFAKAPFALVAILGACSDPPNRIESPDPGVRSSLPWIAFCDADGAPWASVAVAVGPHPDAPVGFDVVAGSERHSATAEKPAIFRMTGSDGAITLTLPPCPDPPNAPQLAASSSSETFGISSLTILFPPTLQVTRKADSVEVANLTWSTIDVVPGQDASGVQLAPGMTTSIPLKGGPITLSLRSTLDSRHLPHRLTASDVRVEAREVAVRTLKVTALEPGDDRLGSAALLSSIRAATAAHVVDHRSDVVVVTRDGLRRHARVVFNDSSLDLAVLEWSEPLPDVPESTVLGRDLSEVDEVWLLVHHASAEFLTLARATGPGTILNPAWPGTSGAGAYVVEHGVLKLAGVVSEHHCGPEAAAAASTAVALRGCAACRGVTKLAAIRQSR